jgi:hypothetical protein
MPDPIPHQETLTKKGHSYISMTGLKA